MNAKKKNSVKLVALVLVLALLMGGAIGGTLAWLFTNTEPVVNTFTVGNIELELKETFNTKSENSESNDRWVGKMVPGGKLAKDPYVKVSADSEDCWVFVEVIEEGAATVGNDTYGFDHFIEYTVDTTKWEEVGTTEKGVVYGYKEAIDTDDEKGKELYLLVGEGEGALKNGFVSVKSTVTKEMMTAVASGTAPKLTFTAFAIQSKNLVDSDKKPVTDAETAWAVYSAPAEGDNSSQGENN